MASTTNGASAAPVPADLAAPANIEPATTFSTSGAPVQLVPDVDPTHPAVDNDPRAGTTVRQNKIDFNDPTIPGDEAVAQRLGMKGRDEAAAEAEARDAEATKAPPAKPATASN